MSAAGSLALGTAPSSPFVARIILNTTRGILKRDRAKKALDRWPSKAAVQRAG